jgi:ABC-type methionine transport system ATPase subunit
MATQLTRFWLVFPQHLVTRPLVYELSREFAVVTNIRQASVNAEVGIISLSLEGESEEIAKAVAWLESLGVQVDPVEMNIIES